MIFQLCVDTVGDRPGLSPLYTHPYELAIVSLQTLIHSIHKSTSTTTKFYYN